MYVRYESILCMYKLCAVLCQNTPLLKQAVDAQFVCGMLDHAHHGPTMHASATCSQGPEGQKLDWGGMKWEALVSPLTQLTHN